MDKQKLKRYLSNPLRIFLKPWIRLAPYIKSDELFLRVRYLFQMGKPLHLNPPRTFNEKLQWLKLHDRRPEYTTMVDKYAVKDYVAKTIGEQYVIPLLAVWDSADDIDISNLPNQFVLKTTNGGGGSSVIICKDKSGFDLESVKKKLNRALLSRKMNFYVGGREWPYKNVRPRIIAEEFLDGGKEGLTDYKIHNFNGIPKLILTCCERFSEKGLVEDFYSDQWTHLELSRPQTRHSGKQMEQPETLKEMLSLSKKLSDKIPFVRTDFYTVGGKVYFGEMTFYPATGMKPFVPEDWDRKLGEWIELPERNVEGY